MPTVRTLSQSTAAPSRMVLTPGMMWRFGTEVKNPGNHQNVRGSMLAENRWRVSSAHQLGLSLKCLVLDLDNTIWGGVIGDNR